MTDHELAGRTNSAKDSLKDVQVKEAAELSPDAIIIDEETNRRLVRKIDKCLMPVVRNDLDPDYSVSQLTNGRCASHMLFNTMTRPSSAKRPFLA